MKKTDFTIKLIQKMNSKPDLTLFCHYYCPSGRKYYTTMWSARNSPFLLMFCLTSSGSLPGASLSPCCCLPSLLYCHLLIFCVYIGESLLSIVIQGTLYLWSLCAFLGTLPLQTIRLGFITFHNLSIICLQMHRPGFNSNIMPFNINHLTFLRLS